MTPFLCSSPSDVKLQSVFNSLGTGAASHLITAITKSRAMQKLYGGIFLREKNIFLEKLQLNSFLSDVRYEA